MNIIELEDEVKRSFEADNIPGTLEVRVIEDECFVRFYIAPDHYSAAAVVAQDLQAAVPEIDVEGEVLYVTVIACEDESLEVGSQSNDPGILSSREFRQLQKSLDEFSRTSEVVPSLEYRQDPRVSFEKVSSLRPYIVYGRRGAGKTALLREIKDHVERRGHVTTWFNCHSFRDLSAVSITTSVFDSIRGDLEKSFPADRVSGFSEAVDQIINATSHEDLLSSLVVANRKLKSLFKDSVRSLYIFLDDFYLLDVETQPEVLDLLFRAIRDTSTTIKIASIEHLTRTYLSDTNRGMQLSQDISDVNLDFTLENPKETQAFLEDLLRSFVARSDVKSMASFVTQGARGRLILASGGVPRDYLNLVSKSIDAAVRDRDSPRKVSEGDVNRAAVVLSNLRKSDLGDDVDSQRSQSIYSAVGRLSEFVRSKGYTFFRISAGERHSVLYDDFAGLVDFRFVHRVADRLTSKYNRDQYFEGYTLNLSEFSDQKLFSSLNILDIRSESWTFRKVGTGKSEKEKPISRSNLRDELLKSPTVRLSDIF